VISSPADYRDVQQELIAEIHRTSIWPVVVNFYGNIRKPDGSVFTDRDSGYIILTPGGKIQYFHAEMLRLYLDTEKNFTKLWNSEAWFVVAGSNTFSMSQQKDIFDFFLKFRIYNCTIVSGEHYDIDKNCNGVKNVNDTDKGMKLGV
jgi:hypothetical protein